MRVCGVEQAGETFFPVQWDAEGMAGRFSHRVSSSWDSVCFAPLNTGSTEILTGLASCSQHSLAQKRPSALRRGKQQLCVKVLGL